MKLQIHHFYDIMRDFGSGRIIKPHDYGHSYHKIVNIIQLNPRIEIEIVLGCDDVCVGCSYLKNGHCLDTINHRLDFHSKETFNNYINTRIMEVCGTKVGCMITPLELCKRAKSYIENIGWIYEGNDDEHTQKRKMHVIAGIKKYKSYIAQ